MTWQPGGLYAFEYNATSGLVNGATHDFISSAGALDLTGLGVGNAFGIDIVSLIAPPSSPSEVTYTIGTFTGGFVGAAPGDVTDRFAITGTFDPITTPSVLISGTNLQLKFTPVPEPAHVLLACAGAAGLARWWRRKSARMPLTGAGLRS